MSILSLDQYLRNFFEEEKMFLLKNYPGLNIHRLRMDLELHAFLNGRGAEDLFDAPYLPTKTNPITIFFEKLKDGMPLEYITGYSFFYRSNFKVTKDVLIPRNETEILVELAVTEINQKFANKACRVLDVGTGSGVIALSVMMEAKAILEMTATDISKKALKLAKENFFNQKFAMSNVHKVNFIETDRLHGVEGTFDFILSNPPYIKEVEDFNTVHEQVINFEPHLALFLPDKEYQQWFEEFFKEIHSKLNADGVSFIEGHENHLEGLARLAKAISFSDAIVLKDYTDRNRFLKLIK